MSTWMIEGEWSGPLHPVGNYTRMQHREYTNRHSFAMAANDLGSITFGDMTKLHIKVTQRHQRDGERLPKIDHAYGGLIRDCIRHKVNNVDALPQCRRGKK